MPTSTRPRTNSTVEARSAKKLKTNHAEQNSDADLAQACFADGLLTASNVDRLSKSYSASDPYLYAVIDKLFQDDLLSKVKDECIGELSFTEKETDIYKVSAQSPSPYV